MTPVSYSKILVCCPGNASSGGPELLHQFVDALRAIGRDAYIVYLPVSQRFARPRKFDCYDAPQSPLTDTVETLIIISEVNTLLTRQIRHAKLAVWWGSVDFFFGITREYIWRDVLTYLRAILFRRRPLFTLRAYRHFAQSQYALAFLRRHQIKGELLSDYLRSVHTHERLAPAAMRENVILYNPKKGTPKTQRLIRRYPQFAFVALEHMTPEEVAAWYTRAKLYIDFGNHPGKDRMPREAAMAGCCVVTGRTGSAAYQEDVPIPDRYKLDDHTSQFESQFGGIVQDIFDRFDHCARDFDLYRHAIRGEEDIFRAQVAALFGVTQHDTLTSQHHQQTIQPS